MTTYTVLVWEYPFEARVSAESKEQAELIALKRLGFDYDQVDKIKVKKTK
jgi:hypothetical protein